MAECIYLNCDSQTTKKLDFANLLPPGCEIHACVRHAPALTRLIMRYIERGQEAIDETFATRGPTYFAAVNALATIAHEHLDSLLAGEAIKVRLAAQPISEIEKGIAYLEQIEASPTALFSEPEMPAEITERIRVAIAKLRAFLVDARNARMGG